MKPRGRDKIRTQNTMNTTITTREIEWSKGFFYTNWSLIVDGKEFLLGQDVKWVMRTIGININDFFKEVGTDDRTEQGRQKIGEWIVDNLNLTPTKIKNLEVWDLCCQ
jgi:hypothetical protein